MADKSSIGPWRLMIVTGLPDEDFIAVMDGEGQEVCLLPRNEQGEANAEVLVRAKAMAGALDMVLQLAEQGIAHSEHRGAAGAEFVANRLHDIRSIARLGMKSEEELEVGDGS